MKGNTMTWNYGGVFNLRVEVLHAGVEGCKVRVEGNYRRHGFHDGEVISGVPRRELSLLSGSFRYAP